MQRTLSTRLSKLRKFYSWRVSQFFRLFDEVWPLQAISMSSSLLAWYTKTLAYPVKLLVTSFLS